MEIKNYFNAVNAYEKISYTKETAKKSNSYLNANVDKADFKSVFDTVKKAGSEAVNAVKSDARSDRIEYLKEKVQSGEYSVSADKILNAMLLMQ